MTLRPARLEDESAERFGVEDRSFTWRQAHERRDRAPSSHLAAPRPLLRRPPVLSEAEKTAARRRRDHTAALAVRRLRAEAGVGPGQSAPPELRDRILYAVNEISGRPLAHFLPKGGQ